jgi:hypothetical protein
MVAAIALTLSSCHYSRMCTAREVYEREELIGFRVKKGNDVYQFLRHPDCVMVERGVEEDFGVDWQPVARKDYGGIVREVFERLEEEGEHKVDLSALLR